jgi:hypothetical protein
MNWRSTAGWAPDHFAGALTPSTRRGTQLALEPAELTRAGWCGGHSTWLADAESPREAAGGESGSRRRRHASLRDPAPPVSPGAQSAAWRRALRSLVAVWPGSFRTGCGRRRRRRRLGRPGSANLAGLSARLLRGAPVGRPCVRAVLPAPPGTAWPSPPSDLRRRPTAARCAGMAHAAANPNLRCRSAIGWGNGRPSAGLVEFAELSNWAPPGGRSERQPATGGWPADSDLGGGALCRRRPWAPTAKVGLVPMAHPDEEPLTPSRVVRRDWSRATSALARRIERWSD